MGTKYKGSKEEVSALDTAIKLVRAAESLMAKASLNLSGNNITISQFGILDAVYHLGPLTQKTLGEKILKSGGNITHVVDNLEKRALVKRHRGKNDRRNFEIHLTKKGEKLITKILPGYVKVIKDQLGILSQEESEALQNLCKKIGKKET
ncbi:MAG: MarR family transcriptional regulator [Ignavibacteriaceae bacterium]|jgi:MarR family 2-MHQ and catechol resistance regulon transcriptional repressor